MTGTTSSAEHGVEEATSEERDEAQALGVRVAELLAGRAILGREVTQDVYLGGTSPSVLLDCFPVHDVRIDGQPSPRGFWIERATGIVGSGGNVPPASYRVDYRVGCEGHAVPVILEILADRVADFVLGVDGACAREVLDVGAAAAAMLNDTAEERARVRKEKV